MDIEDSVGNIVKQVYKNSNNTYDNEKFTIHSLSLDTLNKHILNNFEFNRQMLLNYQRAICNKDGVPIFARNIGYTDSDGVFKVDTTKINRKVNNDFAGYIVQTKAAYIASIPPVVSLRENINMSDENKNHLLNIIDDFKILNSWDSKIINTAEMMGATGKACWVLSMEDGQEKINIINPWEIIEVVPDKLYIRNYKAVDIELNEIEYIEVYDKKYILRYESNGGSFVISNGFPKLHMFDECPIVIFKNNDRMLPDFHNVIELIDQYDRTMSDLTSELEQFRLAYLVITGVPLAKEDAEKFKQTGVLNIKAPAGQVADAKFITKAMDIQQTIRFLQEIQDNIMRFAGSFDSTSDAYTGNLTNFAIHFKLAPMDGRANKSVTSMKDGIMKAFKIIQYSWNLKNIDFNYLDLMFLFTVNKPVNKWEEIKNIVEAGGTISDETLLSMCNSIDSAQNELNRIKKEGKKPTVVSQLELEEMKLKNNKLLSNNK